MDQSQRVVFRSVVEWVQAHPLTRRDEEEMKKIRGKSPVVLYLAIAFILAYVVILAIPTSKGYGYGVHK